VWVLLIEWRKIAPPAVTTTLPSAVPTRVPATPKKDAITAADTEAKTLAMSWGRLIFTGEDG
jgi:hypothetical protein